MSDSSSDSSEQDEGGSNALIILPKTKTQKKDKTKKQGLSVHEKKKGIKSNFKVQKKIEEDKKKSLLWSKSLMDVDEQDEGGSNALIILPKTKTQKKDKTKKQGLSVHEKKKRIKSNLKLQKKIEEDKKKSLLWSKSLMDVEKYKIPDEVYSLMSPSSSIGQVETARDRRRKDFFFAKAKTALSQNRQPLKTGEPTNPSFLTNFSFSYKDYVESLEESNVDMKDYIGSLEERNVDMKDYIRSLEESNEDSEDYMESLEESYMGIDDYRERHYSLEGYEDEEYYMESSKRYLDESDESDEDIEDFKITERPDSPPQKMEDEEYAARHFFRIMERPDSPPQEMGDPSVEVSLEDFDTSQLFRNEAVKELLLGLFPERALHSFRRAICYDPNSAVMYAKRAEIYIREKKPYAAIRDANAALAINKDYAEGYKNRGIAQAVLCNWEEADADLYVASKLDHSEEIGVVAKKIEDYRNYDKLRKARKAEERRAEVQILSSHVVPGCDAPQKMGDPSVKVLKKNRRASKKSKGRAIKAFSEGKLDEAKEHLTQAILLHPTSESMYAARAFVNMKMEKPNFAIQDATAALELSPSCAEAYKLRGFAWTMLGNWKEAAKDLCSALALGHDVEVEYILKRVVLTIHVSAKKINRVEKKLRLPGMSLREILKDSELMADLQDSQILTGFEFASNRPPLIEPFIEKHKLKCARLFKERSDRKLKVKEDEHDRQRRRAYAEAAYVKAQKQNQAVPKSIGFPLTKRRHSFWEYDDENDRQRRHAYAKAAYEKLKKQNHCSSSSGAAPMPGGFSETEQNIRIACLKDTVVMRFRRAYPKLTPYDNEESLSEERWLLSRAEELRKDIWLNIAMKSDPEQYCYIFEKSDIFEDDKTAKIVDRVSLSRTAVPVSIPVSDSFPSTGGIPMVIFGGSIDKAMQCLKIVCNHRLNAVERKIKKLEKQIEYFNSEILEFEKWAASLDEEMFPYSELESFGEKLDERRRSIREVGVNAEALFLDMKRRLVIHKEILLDIDASRKPWSLGFEAYASVEYSFNWVKEQKRRIVTIMFDHSWFLKKLETGIRVWIGRKNNVRFDADVLDYFVTYADFLEYCHGNMDKFLGKLEEDLYRHMEY